ncbi:MAG: hypothetical protein Q7T31_05955, partial [Dietzia sp.]|uniref:helix-turn-helix domain-containing protein n=1 Tax=Dietzia sp. TaxID=1871616 RepID=UPI0027233FFE
MIEEMTGPWGIPDLTALVAPRTKLSARMALPIPPLLHEVDAGVVSVAHPRAARSLSQLAAAVGWPEGTVQRRVSSLTRAGALIETNTGRYVRPAPLEPVGRLYAVEA